MQYLFGPLAQMMMLRVAFACTLLLSTTLAEDSNDEEHEENIYKDSWWYKDHQAEMAAFDEANADRHSPSPGPISDMLENFHIYLGALLELDEHGADGAAQIEQHVKAIRAHFSNVDFDKPVPDGNPEQDFHDSTPSEKVHHRT